MGVVRARAKVGKWGRGHFMPLVRFGIPAGVIPFTSTVCGIDVHINTALVPVRLEDLTSVMFQKSGR